jgi:hypothetical protein
MTGSCGCRVGGADAAGGAAGLLLLAPLAFLTLRSRRRRTRTRRA